nr:TetR/AcrR family transcriptional regulator [Gordonia humi]
MARPSKPLLDHQSVIDTSIELIEEIGMDKFSMPKVARALGVQTSSLYHYFADRNALMTEVARKIMREAPMPPMPQDDDWVEWFVELSFNYREAIRRYPNAAIVLVEFLPRDVLTGNYDWCAHILAESNIDPALHVALLDGLEKISFATVLSSLRRATSSASDTAVFPHADADRHPALMRALAANSWSEDQLFEVTIRSFITGLLHAGTDAVVAGAITVAAS